MQRRRKREGEATIKQVLEENINELRKDLRLQTDRAHKRSKKWWGKRSLIRYPDKFKELKG